MELLLVTTLLTVITGYVFGRCACPCGSVDAGWGSVACVCNSACCQRLDVGALPSNGSVLAVTTDRAGARFQSSLLMFQNSSTNGSAVNLSLDFSEQRQTIMGFGGAMTDAAASNFLRLGSAAGKRLLEAYFDKSGIQYTFIRVPMASCDFSVRVYSYDDVDGDFSLSHFALTAEDLEMKIPLIREAVRMAADSGGVRLFGSPWSAPAWMKTNRNMTGRGFLNPDGRYQQAWADYFVRFLQEYRKRGVELWGLTVQNEPTDGFIGNFQFQAMGWTASGERDFVKHYLGPTLVHAGFSDVKLMILDDTRLSLPWWANTVLEDPEAARYVAGIGVHWYLDGVVPAHHLTDTHQLFPDHFILATEACSGQMQAQPVRLGSWARAEDYAKDIMEDLSNWVTGWLDWNLALDLGGGSNWAGNFVDASVIVNASVDQFYLQPSFYVMGHFSKFLRPGSKLVEVYGELPDGLRVNAFIGSSISERIVIILNLHGDPVSLQLTDVGYGYLSTVVAPHSLTTLAWRAADVDRG